MFALHRRWTLVTVLGLVLTLLTPANASSSDRASPVIGPDLRISGSGADGFDWAPAVAANDADGEYLVVWSDHRGGTGAIYGRRVDAATGARIGTDRRLSGKRAVNADHPAVAWNGNAHEYLIVWQDSRDPSRGTDIFSARLSATAARIGPDRRISGPGATAADVTPAVTYNPISNRYMVVWSDSRDLETRGSDIYGRRVRPDGSAMGLDLRLSGSAARGTDAEPDISFAWTGGGGFLVVWSDLRSQARGFDVFGRRLSQTGARLGRDFRISSAGNARNEYSPAVAWSSASDAYLVVWEDERKATARGTDIFGRVVLEDGPFPGTDIRICGSKAVADDSDPGVAYSRTSSEFLVVWSDARSYSTRADDVYGRRVSPDGTPVGADFRVSDRGGPATQGDPATAFVYDAAGYLVVWADERNSATRDWDIYGRRVAG